MAGVMTLSRNVVRQFSCFVRNSTNFPQFRCTSWPKHNLSTVISNEKPQTEEKPLGVGDEQIDASSQEEAVKNVFEEENKKLIDQIKEIDDKYKRALAENENIRVRMRKQIEDAKLFGIQNFCKDLLDVSDVLSKATESVPKEALVKENTHLVNLYQGLQMTEAQLQSVFRRHGLTPINPIGEKFDPNQHEALFEQVFESKEPGTVFIVNKIGYKLHDRTIRPAAVGIVKAP